MCGRTCLTLAPDQILHACKYRDKHLIDFKEDENSLKQPEWRSEFNCGRNYQPMYNIAPTDVTPVLVAGEHFKSSDESDYHGRVIVPMMWGMIPFWHKGDYRKHGLTTNNCRLEHMMESKLYRGPFQKGQRCVILCEGFYEWQTTQSSKPSKRAAYYLYMPQAAGVKMYDKSTWQANDVNLLKFAGLFDIWEDNNGDKMFSYSVITFESTKLMSWLHHRMPAILESEDQVNDWLDYKRVPDKKALAALRPATHLEWHQVSNLVNNSRNKSEDCNKPMELCGKNKPSTNKLMKWLLVRKKREADIKAECSDSDESDGGAPQAKRQKIKPRSDESEESTADK